MGGQGHDSPSTVVSGLSAQSDRKNTVFLFIEKFKTVSYFFLILTSQI